MQMGKVCVEQMFKCNYKHEAPLTHGEQARNTNLGRMT